MSKWDDDADDADEYSGVYAYALQPPPGWQVPDFIKPAEVKDLTDSLSDYFKLAEETQKTRRFKKPKTNDVRSNGERLCKVCGRLESEHHEFVPIQIPAGCVCIWEEWGDLDNTPEICELFESCSDDPQICKTCEHEEGCHKVNKDSKQ